MLLPRFTIRFLLLVMVGVSLFGTMLTYGLRGYAWLLSISVAIASIAVVLVVHACFQLLIALLAQILPGGKSTNSADPSAPRPSLPEAPH